MVSSTPKFEITISFRYSLITFQYTSLDQSSNWGPGKLLQDLNIDEYVYLAQSDHNGRLVIVLKVEQFDYTHEDVLMVHQVANEWRKNLYGIYNALP